MMFDFTPSLQDPCGHPTRLGIECMERTYARRLTLGCDWLGVRDWGLGMQLERCSWKVRLERGGWGGVGAWTWVVCELLVWVVGSCRFVFDRAKCVVLCRYPHRHVAIPVLGFDSS